MIVGKRFSNGGVVDKGVALKFHSFPAEWIMPSGCCGSKKDYLDAFAKCREDFEKNNPGYIFNAHLIDYEMYKILQSNR